MPASSWTASRAVSREASWVASQVACFVVDAGAGVGVASQVTCFVVDAGAGVRVCGVAECDAGGVGSVISVVGGALFSSPSSGDDDPPSGVATPAPATLARRNPACSWTASFGDTGSQDVPPVASPVASQVVSQVASQGA